MATRNRSFILPRPLLFLGILTTFPRTHPTPFGAGSAYHADSEGFHNRWDTMLKEGDLNHNIRLSIRHSKTQLPAEGEKLRRQSPPEPELCGRAGSGRDVIFYEADSSAFHRTGERAVLGRLWAVRGQPKATNVDVRRQLVTQVTALAARKAAGQRSPALLHRLLAPSSTLDSPIETPPTSLIERAAS